MTFEEGKDKFIQTWGTLGTNWGINRTMAQVHALLLLAVEPLSAEEIMSELQISRGNANMNIRALIDWNLVYKELKAGERKEFFRAEKDMSEIIRQVILHRKKRELEPILKVLDELSTVEGEDQENVEFRNVIKDIHLFARKADSTLGGLAKADSNWFVSTFLKMIK